MRYTIRRRPSLAALALTAAGVLTGCDFTGPLPARAVPMQPPAYYATWWSLIEQCTGMVKPMRYVDWYTVPGNAFDTPSGIRADGLYQNGRIILAAGSVRDGTIVRHEMLHAFISRPGAVAHPREYFLDKCGGLVDCETSCISEGRVALGGPTGLPVIPASQLEISIATDSVVSLGAQGNASYTYMVVKARNPHAYDVSVVLPSTRFNTLYGFTMEVTAPSSPPGLIQARAYGQFTGHFRARESKSYLFDFHLGDRFLGPGGAPGTWQVRGGFGTHLAPNSITFRTTP